MRNEQSIRCTLDNLVTALVYMEQTDGVEVHQRIYDSIALLERLIFDRESTGDRQLELQFTDPDSLD